MTTTPTRTGEVTALADNCKIGIAGWTATITGGLGLVSYWLSNALTGGRPTLPGARRIGASGQYAPGGSMEHVGNQIISCTTTGGILEFAVKRTDVPLLLHYITMRAQMPNPSGQSRER